jgi:hypothetical protein
MLCGLLVQQKAGWLCRDLGDINTQLFNYKSRKSKSNIFTAPTSPALALEVLTWVIEREKVSKDCSLPKGYRNALSVLIRFDLIYVVDDCYVPNKTKLQKYGGSIQAIWTEAGLEETLIETTKLIENGIVSSGKELGNFLDEKYALRWTEASQERNGRAIKQWSEWLIEGKSKVKIPHAPGRAGRAQNTQLTLE